MFDLTVTTPPSGPHHPGTGGDANRVRAGRGNEGQALRKVWRHIPPFLQYLLPLAFSNCGDHHSFTVQDLDLLKELGNVKEGVSDDHLAALDQATLGIRARETDRLHRIDCKARSPSVSYRMLRYVGRQEASYCRTLATQAGPSCTVRMPVESLVDLASSSRVRVPDRVKVSSEGVHRPRISGGQYPLVVRYISWILRSRDAVRLMISVWD